MSMIFHFLSLDEETVSQLKNLILDVETFLYDQDGDGSYEQGENDLSLDIDKSWEIIHFALTGKTMGDGETADSILEKVIMGGKEIGKEMGYGAARLLEIEEVKEIAKELNKISVDKFIEICEGRNFSNTQLYAFDEDDLEAEIEGASEYFDQIREYYLEAASHNEFMLLYLN